MHCAFKPTVIKKNIVKNNIVNVVPKMRTRTEKVCISEFSETTTTTSNFICHYKTPIKSDVNLLTKLTVATVYIRYC